MVLVLCRSTTKITSDHHRNAAENGTFVRHPGCSGAESAAPPLRKNLEVHFLGVYGAFVQFVAAKFGPGSLQHRLV